MACTQRKEDLMETLSWILKDLAASEEDILERGAAVLVISPDMALRLSAVIGTMKEISQVRDGDLGAFVSILATAEPYTNV